MENFTAWQPVTVDSGRLLSFAFSHNGRNAPSPDADCKRYAAQTRQQTMPVICHLEEYRQLLFK
ncbi:MAG: hypothetical protein ONB51_11190 [candidate division KSB1 bacterium]|nr:hypothetical protein [candidate division KSB1 bacterium]MDZ7409784.1 hypothetical protein [candidate division KSB1 bacterium]